MPIGLRGTLSFGVDGCEVVVSDEIPEEQRALVAAHEIGHLMLEHSDMLNSVGWGRVDSSSIEQTCDRIARELTMPAAWVRGSVPRDNLDIGTLHSLAREAGVSAPSMAQRLSDLRFELDYYRYSDDGFGSWLLDSCVGAAQGGSVELNLTTLASVSDGYTTLDQRSVRGAYSGASAFRAESCIEVLVSRAEGS